MDIEPLMVTSRAVTSAVVRSLEEVDPGMPLPQLRALVMIGMHQPVTVGAIAVALGINPSNASRACDRLVERALVRRGADGADARRVSLSLTGAGAALLDQVLDRRRQELAAVVDAMDPEQRRALLTALEVFNEAAVRVGLLVTAEAPERHFVELLR